MKPRNALQLLAAGLLVSAVSGAALAQDSNEDFKRPLRSGRTKAAQPSTSGKSTTVMRQDDGDNTVELRIEGGNYSAKLNGKEVPKDRIVKDEDGVRILDKDGNTVTTFQISSDGDRTTVFGQPATPKPPRAGGRAGGGSGGGAGGWTPLPGQPSLPANPPKVMIGIIMDAPSEELLKNYGLKEGESILVTRIVEGLPADKAGLRENDIITEIDGKKPVDQDTLREILKSKEPGDTVEFTVLRKGGDKSIRVTLGKYDPEKLGAAMNPGENQVQVWGPDTAPEDVQKALREAMKNGQWSFRTPGNGHQGFVMGGPGSTPDMDKKLAELDQKMADLDKKLERVDDQIAKLQGMIEKLAEQRSRK